MAAQWRGVMFSSSPLVTSAPSFSMRSWHLEGGGEVKHKCKDSNFCSIMGTWVHVGITTVGRGGTGTWVHVGINTVGRGGTGTWVHIGINTMGRGVPCNLGFPTHGFFFLPEISTFTWKSMVSSPSSITKVVAGTEINWCSVYSSLQKTLKFHYNRHSPSPLKKSVRTPNIIYTCMSK